MLRRRRRGFARGESSRVVGAWSCRRCRSGCDGRGSCLDRIQPGARGPSSDGLDVAGLSGVGALLSEAAFESETALAQGIGECACSRGVLEVVVLDGMGLCEGWVRDHGPQPRVALAQEAGVAASPAKRKADGVARVETQVVVVVQLFGLSGPMMATLWGRYAIRFWRKYGDRSKGVVGGQSRLDTTLQPRGFRFGSVQKNARHGKWADERGDLARAGGRWQCAGHRNDSGFGRALLLV